jgi:hypothetical protein
MNSSAKVGKIFTEAGASFHKLADMTVMLEPAAAELHELNQKHSQEQHMPRTNQGQIQTQSINGGATMTKLVMGAPLAQQTL